VTRFQARIVEASVRALPLMRCGTS